MKSCECGNEFRVEYSARNFVSSAGNICIQRRTPFHGMREFPPLSSLTYNGLYLYFRSISTTLIKYIFILYHLINDVVSPVNRLQCRMARQLVNNESGAMRKKKAVLVNFQVDSLPQNFHRRTEAM
jgi:hypothetical protein